MRNRLAGGSESHQKALEALLQDCLKKCFETSKNLAIKRARKRAHAHENSNEEEDISDVGEAAGTAGAFWVYDPEIGEYRDINGWIWNERDRRNLVVIQTKTLDGIWDMVKAHVPANRKVGEILGALKDPNPPNLSFPADYTGLHSDAEVKAFFRMSKSDPVRLMVLLHSVPTRANTPPRAHPYFELKKFILRNEYEDFAKDSDVNVRNVTGVRRRWMSTRDHTFEQRIIDSDDEDYCYIRCLKRPKITSGPQLVKACQVVAQTIPSCDVEDKEDEDEETILQPPHIALSSKRHAASDRTRPTRKLCIQYAPSQTLSSRLQSSPPAPPASRRRLHTHTESSVSNLPSDGFNFDSETPQEQQIDLTVNKPSRVGPQSRSFFAIPDEYKELTSRAAVTAEIMQA
ncbi:hypothetical protein BGX38DRAFT_1277516 [Terfezia claveryi]|nr:hypothetical protein BGX38DRAFT_1277516 [Terfezia claveryi]